jgi:hypothetical protein
MFKSLFTFMFAALMWVQVPQWSDDWSKCAVDVPDPACHWYVVAPDNTFGEGFDWATAPWFSVEGLLDISKLNNTVKSLQTL